MLLAGLFGKGKCGTGGEGRIGPGQGGTGGGLLHQILCSAVGREAQHGTSQVCTYKTAGADFGAGPMVGPGALFRERRQTSLSPEETRAAAMAPAGSSSSHFGASVPLGAGQFRSGLTIVFPLLQC